MLVISAIMHLGSSGLPDKAITRDDSDRLQLCLKVLCDRSSLLRQIFTGDCREALGSMLEAQVQVEAVGGERKGVAIQRDSPINFLQLSKLDSLVGAGDMLDLSLTQALGTGKISKADFASSKLSKVTQLTGFSDPVYAEAYVNVNHVDIMDYIVPASCTETEFRSMWAEFEWENKVSVNTSLTELTAYLSSLLASTNMKCLTPDKA